MAVSQWENDRAVPRMGVIQRLSDHFKIPKSAIIDADDDMRALANLDEEVKGRADDVRREYERLKAIQELVDVQDEANKLWAKQLEGARPVKGMEMGYVPLRGRVHMGTPTEPEVYEKEMVLAPQFLIDDDPDLYACTSEGDCMNRVYPEGCIIFVSPNKEPQSGSVAVVTIDGTETVMRRMFRTASTLVLSPDSYNPDNKDIVITSDDERTVEYGGKVVWFQANGEME